MLLDGQLTATLPQRHESVGPSYLRIRCNAVEPEKGRLLIDSVEMTAAGPSSANAAEP